MKKNIFTLLFTICCLMSYAQENATAYVYHPLSEFGTDTLRFLKTNFERKSGYFKGKPLGEVLKYYKSYIKSFTIVHYEYPYYYAALKNKNIPVISFDVYISQQPRIYDGKFWRDMPDCKTDEEEAEYASSFIVDHIRVFYVKR